MMKLYGVPGWGSTISEVMLTLADIPYQFVNVDGFDQPGPQRELLQKLNPLCQVPTLALENGAIMTETAAIALMVLDVYPTFTFADYPERWAPDAPEQLQKNCIAYRKSLYLWFESQLKAAPFALGERLTLLDVYIAVARTWGPRHDWFAANTPKFTAIADTVCQLPELHKVLKANTII